MNEYEECLYAYAMDQKFKELYERMDYLTLERERREAEEELAEKLTEEARASFCRYLEQENAVYSLELRHAFSLGFSAAIRLTRL